MESKYEYIIKYSFRGGQGSWQMSSSKPINSLRDVKLIKEILEKDKRLTNVAIEGYTLVSSKIKTRKFIK